MKYYNIETRNPNGVFYRTGDWGIERDMSGDTNFTSVVPPQESLDGEIPCDWNGTEWVLDRSNYQELREKAYKAEADELYLAYVAQTEDLGAEATEAKAAWLAKREEIKARYPKA